MFPKLLIAALLLALAALAAATCETESALCSSTYQCQNTPAPPAVCTCWTNFYNCLTTNTPSCAAATTGGYYSNCLVTSNTYYQNTMCTGSNTITCTPPPTMAPAVAAGAPATTQQDACFNPCQVAHANCLNAATTNPQRCTCNQDYIDCVVAGCPANIVESFTSESNPDGCKKVADTTNTVYQCNPAVTCPVFTTPLSEAAPASDAPVDPPSESVAPPQSSDGGIIVDAPVAAPESTSAGPAPVAVAAPVAAPTSSGGVIVTPTAEANLGGNGASSGSALISIALLIISALVALAIL